MFSAFSVPTVSRITSVFSFVVCLSSCLSFFLPSFLTSRNQKGFGFVYSFYILGEINTIGGHISVLSLFIFLTFYGMLAKKDAKKEK